jgi:hypothetical protein
MKPTPGAPVVKIKRTRLTPEAAVAAQAERERKQAAWKDSVQAQMKELPAQVLDQPAGEALGAVAKTKYKPVPEKLSKFLGQVNNVHEKKP